MNTYKNNPYNPFPPEMRGTNCELDEGKYTRFISIFYIEYNREKIERYKVDGIYDSMPIEDYLSLVKGEYDEEELFFIYKVETYKIAKTLLPENDDWKFNTSIQDYERYGFVDLNDVAAFCLEQWGVSLSDFVPIYETQIPH